MSNRNNSNEKSNIQILNEHAQFNKKNITIEMPNTGFGINSYQGNEDPSQNSQSENPPQSSQNEKQENKSN